MRLSLAPLFAALALPALPVHAAPAAAALPELSVAQWAGVQAGLTDGLRGLAHLGGWAWGAAGDAVHELAQEDEHAQSKDKAALTIWQILNEDPHSFSKLVKIINFANKTIDVLDDKDIQITFFAPNNDALTLPKHGHHDDDDELFGELIRNPSLPLLSAALDSPTFSLAGVDSGDDDNDDKDHQHRIELLRKLAYDVLKYHGIPKAYTAQELAQNSTIATALKAHDGSYAGLHRRIRIEKSIVPPSLKLNFYAKVLVSDIKARNGVVHTLDHPLLPPGSIIEELFLFPEHFSTLTSSIQKIHARHSVDYGYDRERSEPGKPRFHGAGLATLFAPNNAAFAALPPRLKFYLFSPFGERALGKLLAYHYVPHTLLLSELVYHEKHDHDHDHDHDHGKHGHDRLVNLADDPSFHKEFEVPTALPNATLKIVADKTKFLPVEGAVKTTIKVNDQQVEVIDIPARNGASHVIGKLLVPPHKHHDDDGADVSGADSWDDWERWLPAWADQE
ncbi:hypothetical protein Q5752_006570 [Cryptotrichosporon argae]